MPLNAIITSHQLGFFKRFAETLQPGSPRSRVFQTLVEDENEEYIQHYVKLSSQYTSKEEIYNEQISVIKQQIKQLADEGSYKFQIYLQMNPKLEPSPYLNLPHPLSESIIKFRLGSHKLPIETGRWKGLSRMERVCPQCQVLGDEHHFIYSCSRIRRDDLQLPTEVAELWKTPDVFKLFSRLLDDDLM